VDCVVCGATYAGLVDEVTHLVRTHGTFRAGDLWAFWQRFRRHLCAACRARMARVPVQTAHAERLLVQALELNPGNEVVQQNLHALRTMT
jgi:hypothetical protein